VTKRTDRTPSTRARPRARRGWKTKFTAALAESCNVTAACDAAGVARSSAYEARTKDREFAKAWDDALEQGVDTLELEARRRAVDGVARPVYQGGKLVGAERVYSDTLLQFLLRAHRPERFSERYRIEHAGRLEVGLTLTQLYRLAGEDER
jgi:hypothetical protein